MTARLLLCIPTYNRRDYLDQCLDQVAAQSWHDFRVVIVDNGGDQDLTDVLERWRGLDITLVRRAHNVGAIENINRILQTYRSAAEFLMVWHDDDLMHPRLLETALKILDSHPKIAFAAAECQSFALERPLDAWDKPSGSYRLFDDTATLARILLGGTPLQFGSVVYRSSSLAAASLDISRFSIIADRPFLLDLARAGGGALIGREMVGYRHHDRQDSRSQQLTEDNLIALYSHYRECLPQYLVPRDRRLLWRQSTNGLLDSYCRLPAGSRPSLAAYIGKCRQAGVWHPAYLREPGLSALCVALGLPWASALWRRPRAWGIQLGLGRLKARVAPPGADWNDQYHLDLS